jgi:hypothetical protein
MIRKSSLIALGAILTASSGCAAPTVPASGIECSTLAAWTTEDSVALADEIETFGPTVPNMTRAVREYRVIRKACR